MAVTEADVRKIADLARLSIAAESIPIVAAELNGILRHMDVLQQVDTKDVQPSAGVGADGMPLRPDSVAPHPMNSTAPALAAESRDGFILVPRLATHEDL
ncbi:MAG: Asp-tRNA(Asn)/Glu-tRNA(Gln) amidotransferase subunit GatC [Gemmatimonadaceae bacterium]